jgi:IS1 family transposase
MAGFAQGLSHQVLCSVREDHLEDVDFDSRQYNFIRCQTNGLPGFARALQNRIEAIVGKVRSAKNGQTLVRPATAVWTWVALDPDSKLVRRWFIGPRHAGCAYHFLHDLKDRLANRVQLTTDGHRAYLDATERVFGTEIDYAQLQKIYGSVPETPETRYSPAVCMGARKAVINGSPDHKHISTSYVERQNLTMRMSMRRFTRLTNGFSKKLENLEHAVALHYMHYNFCRIHQTLRVTPAMEAGVSDHVWSLDEVIAPL